MKLTCHNYITMLLNSFYEVQLVISYVYITNCDFVHYIISMHKKIKKQYTDLKIYQNFIGDVFCRYLPTQKNSKSKHNAAVTTTPNPDEYFSPL